MGKNVSTENRINFLIDQFNVFDVEDMDEVETAYDKEGYPSIIQLKDPLNDDIIALYGERYRNAKSSKVIKKIHIEVNILGRMIAADPTNNKQFVQWMLKVFTNMIKNGEDRDAVRFACEDLPMAKEYLELFEANKRKQTFLKFCKSNFNLNHIQDYTNINQYNSLTELFDSVDPYIERDVSGLKAAMQRFVNMGDAEITFKDRDFMVYIPKTVHAACVFHKFTNWCTAVPNNGMFKSYTKDHKRSKKRDSVIYDIIPTALFEGKSEELYQLHFETGQFMNRRDNGTNGELLFEASKGLKDYFTGELYTLLEDTKGVIHSNNQYITWVYKFKMGFLMFDLLFYELYNLRFRDKDLIKIPDSIGKFKNLKQLSVTGCKIGDVHPNIGTLSNLEVLSLNRNNIKALPDTVSNLKNLRFLSLNDNPITTLPKSISELDSSNGGNLIRIATNNHHLIKEIEVYLPNAIIIDNSKTERIYDKF